MHGIKWCVAFILGLTFYNTSYAQTLGTQELSFTIPNTDRIITAEIYYPTDARLENKDADHGIWKRKAFTKDAVISSKSLKYPLVLFSHGWTGDRFGNSWIAEALVEQGYIVAMIDHTHNTSYEHSDLFIYTSMWQRPLDMTALLNYLLQHPSWGKAIDQTKIAAGGFSLGGLTALWLGGIEGDPKAFKEAMIDYARWDAWPQAARDKASKVNWNQAARSYYDPRIKAVFAISPALGDAFKAEGIKHIKTPTLLIVGDKDEVTPAKENAAYYASHIKESKLLTIKGAGHFTFLNVCSTLGTRISGNLCYDAPNIKRDQTHKEVGEKITSFLKENL